jgi:secretion/DNA translocation related TadE-like protein
MTSTRGRERGSVTVLIMVVVVLAGVFALQVARLGSAMSARSRADTAADASALAAAVELARGHSASDAMRAAARLAATNGARLVSCACTGRPSVVVRVGAATGRARAEIDAACPVLLDACVGRL